MHLFFIPAAGRRPGRLVPQQHAQPLPRCQSARFGFSEFQASFLYCSIFAARAKSNGCPTCVTAAQGEKSVAQRNDLTLPAHDRRSRGQLSQGREGCACCCCDCTIQHSRHIRSRVFVLTIGFVSGQASVSVSFDSIRVSNGWPASLLNV